MLHERALQAALIRLRMGCFNSVAPIAKSSIHVQPPPLTSRAAVSLSDGIHNHDTPGDSPGNLFLFTLRRLTRRALRRIEVSPLGFLLALALLDELRQFGPV